jgi:hypothetical protein
MSTLSTMKSRIAAELARTDLTSLIATAIQDAIDAYTDERFHFAESRAVTFSTVASQEFYDSDDAAAIATINVIDYACVYVGDVPHTLRYERPEDMEHLSVNGTQEGTPWSFTWYGDQIRLYPVPDQAYTVRIGAAVKVAAPATDGEASNPWMTYAERLIRSRAKLELALHVLKDEALAATMSNAVTEAWGQLKSRTNQLTQAHRGRVRAMDF